MPTEITPDMSLPLPVVGEQDGPEWAENLNSCLTIIDGHTHTSGSGVPITPDAIDINADVAFNDNNAISLRTSRYTSQAAPLALLADLACVYVVSGELYYNDLDGNQVKLTDAGAPAGGAGTITGLPSGTASAAFSGTTFSFRSATNTPASMNVGPVKIRQAVLNGFGVTLTPAVAQAADYSVTLPAALPSVASLIKSDTSGNLTFLPSGANVRASEGAGTVTLVSTDNPHQVFNTSGAVVCVLPSAGVTAGQVYRMENVGTSTLEVQSSGANNLCYVNSLYSFVELTALQATPTTAAHWKVNFSYNQFQYVAGTAYAGGLSPTVSGTGWTTVRATFIPYQAQDASWRLRFNIYGTVPSASRTLYAVAVNGVTFKAGTTQSCSGSTLGSGSGVNPCNAYVDASSGTVNCISVNVDPFDRYGMSGDVELNAKPTWAY